MPAKAKLTTRERSTSNVSSDNLNKGSELTFAEADSNFINLRDQSFAISDGATTTDIEAGETITFSGASVSGNTITITGGGGAANTGDFVFSGSTMSGTVTNGDIQVIANGSGQIKLDGQTIRVGEDDSTGVNIFHHGNQNAAPTIRTPKDDDDLVFKTTSSGTSNNGGHFVFNTGGIGDTRVALQGNSSTGGQHFIGAAGINGDTIIANGIHTLNSTTGVFRDAGYFSAKITVHSGDGFSDTNADIDLQPLGTGEVNLSGNLDMNNNDIINGGNISNDAIQIADNQIATTRSNDDLILGTTGTGEINLDAKTRFNKNYTEDIQALTSATTIAVDCSLAPVFTVTLAHSATFNFSNLATGQSVSLIIRQDGTGSRTGAFTSVLFPGNEHTLSTGANEIDIISIFNDGTSLLGNISKDYS